MLSALAGANRVLCLGIGGGGDVVGALAVAEAALVVGTPTIVGGLTWERLPVDPRPGPRRLPETSGTEALNDLVALARPDARGPGGFLFAEAHVARVRGERTVLVDPDAAPSALGAAIAQAAVQLGCDLVVFLDVGGDALAHGNEPGLGSPLADAVCLAAAPAVKAAGIATLGVVFGVGCDGELTPSEALARLAEVSAAGGARGAFGLEPPSLARLEEAARAVPTEASAMALRCARGETGTAVIRGGRRTVELSPLGALAFAFDPQIALETAAHCAAAVRGATSLSQANKLLNARGTRTELDYERERSRA